MADGGRTIVAESAAFTRAVETVVNAAQQSGSLIVVTGDKGTGKTTLCHALARHFGPRTFGSLILTPPATTDALWRQILLDFGVADVADSVGRLGSADALADRSDRNKALRSFLRSVASAHIRTVVVVDNAQDLTPDVLREILRMSSFATGEPALSQVALVGNPSVDLVLERPDFRQWLGHATMQRHSLVPLAMNEIKPFIERRWWLGRGGSAGLVTSAKTPRLTEGAVAAIARASQGNPGLVSDIGDRMIAAAESGGPHRIGARRARQALITLGLDTGRANRGIASRASLALFVLLLVAALVFSVRNTGRLLAIARVAGARIAPASPAEVAVSRPAVAMSRPEDAVTSSTAAPIPVAAEEPQATGLDTVEDAPAVPTAPSATASPRAAADEPPADFPTFQALERDALDRARRLAAAPDVMALLQIQEEVRAWDAAGNHANHAAVEGLLVELERLTNEARARQLADDGRLFQSVNSR